ncbi:hypothetical protein MHK_010803 [Candidatus Magnetomorum sp. HK-1]|nr:hypothetical protein MHK_010803 [Candidatus Magnetomorum sp. HK-1]
MNSKNKKIIIETLDGKVIGIKDSFKRFKETEFPEYEGSFKSEKIANELAKELKDWDIGSLIILYLPKNLWISQKRFREKDKIGRNLTEIITCKFTSFPTIRSLIQVIFTFLSTIYSVEDEIVLADNIEKEENIVNLSTTKTILKSLVSKVPVTVSYSNHPLEKELYHAFLVNFYWMGTCTPFSLCLNFNEETLTHSEYFPGRIINIVQGDEAKAISNKKFKENEIDELFTFIQTNFKDSFVDLMLKISLALPDDNTKNRFNNVIVKYCIFIEKNINETLFENGKKYIFDLPKWLKKDQDFENKIVNNIQNTNAIDLFRYHYLIKKLDSKIINPKCNIEGYDLPLLLCEAEDIGYLYLNTNGFTSDSYEYFLKIFEKYKEKSPNNFKSFKAISDIYLVSIKNDIKLLNKYISQGFFDPSLLTKNDWKKIWDKYKNQSKKIIEHILDKSTTEKISLGLAEFILVDNVWDEFMNKLKNPTLLWLIEKLPQKILSLSKTKKFLDPLIENLNNKHNSKQLREIALNIPQSNQGYSLNSRSSFKIMKYICDEGLNTSIERMISLFFFTKDDISLRIDSLIMLVNWFTEHEYIYKHWPQRQTLFSHISNMIEDLLIKDFEILIKYFKLLPPPWEINNYQLPKIINVESVYKEITNAVIDEDETTKAWLLMILSSFSVGKVDIFLFFRLKWTKNLIYSKQSLTFWETVYSQMPNDRISFFLIPLLIYSGSSKKISVQPLQKTLIIKLIKEYITNVQSLPDSLEKSFILLKNLDNIIISIDENKNKSLIKQFSVEISNYIHNIIDKIVTEINITDNASIFFKYMFVNYFKHNNKAWCNHSLLELIIRISKDQHEFLLEVSDEVKKEGKLIIWIGYLLAMIDLGDLDTCELILHLRKRVYQDWPSFADTILIENSKESSVLLMNNLSDINYQY